MQIMFVSVMVADQLPGARVSVISPQALQT